MITTMKPFAKTSAGRYITKKRGLSNLPSAVFVCALLLIAISCVGAEESDCSGLKRNKCRKSRECSWVRRRKNTRNIGQCVTKLTDDACKKIEKKFNCKRHRCKWNKENESCGAKNQKESDDDNDDPFEDKEEVEGEDGDSTSEDSSSSEDKDKDEATADDDYGREITDDDVDDDRKTPENSSEVFHKRFVDKLMGMDAKHAKRLIDSKRVIICSYDIIITMGCVSREYDPSRIKLMVEGETNEVLQVVDNSFLHEEYSENLRGMDGEAARRQINGLFVAICPNNEFNLDSDDQCMMKNLNESRIKLMVDTDNIVEDIVFG